MRVGMAILAVVAALTATWWLARDLAPPKALTFAAGLEGGGYWSLAQRYKAILSRDGIAVTVLETAGSVENAALLAEGRADVALLQGGIDAPEAVEGLAAILHEPLFVFARRDREVPANPGDWSDLRIAGGAEGSGTRDAAADLLDVARPDSVEIVPLSGHAATDALLAGQVDAALYVAPVTAGYLQPLLASGEVHLVQLDHLEAISRRVPQSTIVTLYAGAIDLAPLVPAEETRLMALVARLVAQDVLHPSLVDRLVMAALQIHGGRGPVTAQDAFPSLEGLALPVDVYAEEVLRDGPSPLHQYLPYWVVAQISRFAILLLPVLFLLLPLFRVLPGLYAWRMRSRVFRHYQTILEVDSAAREAASAQVRQALLDRLEALDRELAELRLPLPYRDYAYTARVHVDLIRKRLQDGAGAG